MVYWKGTNQHHESQQTGQNEPEGYSYITKYHNGFLIRSAILLIILFLYYPLLSYISKYSLQSINDRKTGLYNLRTSNYSVNEIPASGNNSEDQQNILAPTNVDSSQSSSSPAVVNSVDSASSQNTTHIVVNGKQVNVTGNGAVSETVNSDGTKTDVDVQSNSQSSTVNLNVSSSSNGD
jgi:hypothetical protein